jgi:hypothetical protein
LAEKGSTCDPTALGAPAPMFLSAVLSRGLSVV